MNISPIFSYYKWGFSIVIRSFSGGGANSQLTHFRRCGEAVPAGSERLLRYVQRTVGLPSQSKTGTPLKAVRKGPNQLGLKAHHLMTSAIHPLKTWKIMEFPHVQGGKYIFIHGGFSIVMLVFRVVIIFLNFKNSEHQRNRNAKPTPVCWWKCFSNPSSMSRLAWPKRSGKVPPTGRSAVICPKSPKENNITAWHHVCFVNSVLAWLVFRCFKLRLDLNLWKFPQWCSTRLLFKTAHESNLLL